jgi:hypothetical protein
VQLEFDVMMVMKGGTRQDRRSVPREGQSAPHTDAQKNTEVDSKERRDREHDDELNVSLKLRRL